MNFFGLNFFSTWLMYQKYYTAYILTSLFQKMLFDFILNHFLHNWKETLTLENTGINLFFQNILKKTTNIWKRINVLGWVTFSLFSTSQAVDIGQFGKTEYSGNSLDYVFNCKQSRNYKNNKNSCREINWITKIFIWQKDIFISSYISRVFRISSHFFSLWYWKCFYFCAENRTWEKQY